ncbi:MAG: Histidyl-tRNA synthetase [uncultured Sphingomonadaceae bacterium]|uniref:Histidine--tRNA ligase n=1 Tax=uncultured Sphingomonadaceae bacterium TaxID=169976 RepID=A0A6J4TDP8_9SPHN|nr:MAG: Histidyl-tRNA synthetase [uncultured Sphingomonadaceae bacterium]
MPLPQAVRGTQSLIGEAADRFHHVVSVFDRVRRLYGFGRVEVPVFERTEVFARSLGEATDVVSKEMYTFPDRGGESLTLRPEFTAGIARAYLSEGWQQYAPVKLATWGPAFRYERPQKGRFRQFHQLDAEIIGAGEPAADVELIAMGAQLLSELGIAEHVTLQLNTLGDAETRDAWRAALVAHFEAHREELSEDSRARLAKNPLRILDSKAPQDRPIADAAPAIDAFLTMEAADFFAAVTGGLDAAGVAWTRNARLVRGLDYYRHTAFEFVTDQLGAQGTVIGGGRYDGLIETMGGPATPAVGWASGIERLAMLVETPARDKPLFSVIPDEVGLEKLAIQVTHQLRQAGLDVYEASRGSPKRRAELARKAGVDALIYVRKPSDDEPLNVSVIRGSRFAHDKLQMEVFGNLPQYDVASGDII